MAIHPYQDHNNLLTSVPLPELLLLRQRFARPRVEDVAAEVATQITAMLESQEVAEKVVPGARIAIAVGSRGIASIALIVQTIVSTLKRSGAEPFVVPAMGSHGGATPEGQLEVLTSLGITRESIGAPIISSLAVDQLGTLPGGMPVYIDQAAHQADGIIVINRIKPHTDFSAPIESGLAKMVAIGLGKRRAHSPSTPGDSTASPSSFPRSPNSLCSTRLSLADSPSSRTPTTRSPRSSWSHRRG